jgi:hypothetical protein
MCYALPADILLRWFGQTQLQHSLPQAMHGYTSLCIHRRSPRGRCAGVPVSAALRVAWTEECGGQPRTGVR